MTTYTVLFAEDVPHYGIAEIEADNAQDAIETAKAYWVSTPNGRRPTTRTGATTFANGSSP